MQSPIIWPTLSFAPTPLSIKSAASEDFYIFGLWSDRVFSSYSGPDIPAQMKLLYFIALAVLVDYAGKFLQIAINKLILNNIYTSTVFLNITSLTLGICTDNLVAVYPSLIQNHFNI